MSNPDACETPYKQKFDNLTTATKAAKAIRRRPSATPVRPYRCGQHWHVASTIGGPTRHGRR